MPYDEGLAERIRGAFSERTDVAEKRMFGGIAFMVRGRMCVGIVKEDLMVRVGAAAHDALAQEPNARPMDFTGRPMKGLTLRITRRFRIRRRARAMDRARRGPRDVAAREDAASRAADAAEGCAQA